ncbi:flagellar basal body L-ring protein FlgH [Desulfosoma caldarium]|nr:flagellar basal body L-ring protein FlgH [Desulfosoma caldarium]
MLGLWAWLWIGTVGMWGCATQHTTAGRALEASPPSALSSPAPQQEWGFPSTDPSQPKPVPTGSLWSARQESLFRDIKAHRVGDIVTIMVSEQSKASKQASTSTSRRSAWNGAGNFMGLSTPSKTILEPVNKTGYGLSFDSAFTGKGSTTKADSMTAYMTATVTEILPNGNLVIRGSRWTKVNDELQQIVLEGVVRPMDITRDNTVLSQNIAEAKIFFVGKGPVSRHQKPSLFGQLLDLILPF